MAVGPGGGPSEPARPLLLAHRGDHRLVLGLRQDAVFEAVGRGHELLERAARGRWRDDRERRDVGHDHERDQHGEHERQRRVVEGERRGARHRSRHIGDAVVHDLVDDVGRLGMGGRARGLGAAALIDGDVDHHAAGAHPPQQDRKSVV